MGGTRHSRRDHGLYRTLVGTHRDRGLQLIGWIGLSRSKFYSWRNRYGKANEHNALVPRDHWLEAWEKVAMINFHHQFPLEGYRRLTFMMLDRNVVAVSPSSTFRVLKAAGLLQRWNPKPSRKGTGFQQPLEPHEHWHVDISYLKFVGTFFYLCSGLDGCSAGCTGHFSDADCSASISRAALLPARHRQRWSLRS